MRFRGLGQLAALQRRQGGGAQDPRQRAIGSSQVDLVLSALLRMEKQADRLTGIAMRYAS